MMIKRYGTALAMFPHTTLHTVMVGPKDNDEEGEQREVVDIMTELFFTYISYSVISLTLQFQYLLILIIYQYHSIITTVHTLCVINILLYTAY